MSPLIAIHALAATFALLFGAFQLFRKKGTRPHKIIGRVWVLAMYTVIFTSFGITTLNGGFSWLHGLSLLTLITVSIGLYAVFKGNIASHKAFMQGSYFGLLGAFIGVIAVPSRRIPQMAMHDTSTFIFITAMIIVISFAVTGVVELTSKKKKKSTKI
jgi:uncharacterized membrane protein